ncbi:MAG TPA: DUF2182 domain-containing protein [Alphaproteobacteria bacterium]
MDQAINPSVLERLLRRDRVLTFVALLGISVLAWAYILAGAGMDVRPTDIQSMRGMAMPTHWTASHFALMLAMWAVMMFAMMLPSAAPMVLLFATIERRRHEASPYLAIATFAAAYVLVWSGFSVAATGLQWLLDRLALLSPTMSTTNAILGGAVSIAAGIYQFTPLKRACLRSCRSPLEFLSRYWSSGPFGIGLRHGLYCVGCCWMIMLLLFVGGIMNVTWIALIAAFVLVEKLFPRGEWAGFAGGVALIAWGGWTLCVQIS